MANVEKHSEIYFKTSRFKNYLIFCYLVIKEILPRSYENRERHMEI